MAADIWCLSREPNCQAAWIAGCLTVVLCRAFALEGRGIWHALSASITQQVIGPVRARADFRYALDLPSSIPQVTAGSALLANLLTARLGHSNAVRAMARVQQTGAAWRDTYNSYSLDCIADNWRTCAQVVYLMSGCGSI